MVLVIVRYGSIGEEVSFNCSSTLHHQRLAWYDGFLKFTMSLQLHGVSIQRIADDTITITIQNLTLYHYGVYKCVDDDTGVVLMNVSLLAPQGEQGSHLLNMWDA